MSGQTEILQARSLQGLLPGLSHGFSANLPFADLPSFKEALRHLLERSGSTNGARPVMLEQPHAANILHTGNGDADAAMGGAVLAAGEPLRELGGGFAKGYDGAAATLAAPALLTVRAADCVPVLAVDPERGAYGALHAGWRGIAAGILPNLLAGWREAGSSLGAVRLAFGPGIRVCCFEVQADCLGAFDVALLADTVQRVGGATHLDLVGVLRGQARAVGLSDEQVEVLPYCTTCHQDGAGEFPFASYRRSRRDGTRTPGRNASFIGVPVASAGH